MYTTQLSKLSIFNLILISFPAEYGELDYYDDHDHIEGDDFFVVLEDDLLQ